MRVSELLELPVLDADGRHVGTVIDVRLLVEGDPADHPQAPQLAGLVVSPRTRSSYLGYERSRVDRPRLVAALLRWRHRGTFLASWQDVAVIETARVVLRAGYTRRSPVLE
jgi:hypothetical protein